MKVECVKLNLKNALLSAERFTGKQLSLPILRYVLFIASENVLKLRATNLDIGIEIEIPATITHEGTTVIKGDILATVCNNINQSQDISIQSDNDSSSNNKQ